MRPLDQADGLLPEPREADVVDADDLVAGQQLVHLCCFTPLFDLKQRRGSREPLKRTKRVPGTHPGRRALGQASQNSSPSSGRTHPGHRLPRGPGRAGHAHSQKQWLPGHGVTPWLCSLQAIRTDRFNCFSHVDPVPSKTTLITAALRYDSNRLRVNMQASGFLVHSVLCDRRHHQF